MTVGRGPSAARFVHTPWEPLIVSACPDARGILIVVHAPGENRTGNNYLFAEMACGLSMAGYAVARFDLAGFGESSSAPSIRAWDAQLLQATQVMAAEFPTLPTHVLSRGISCGLLPAVWRNGMRIALSPPQPGDIRALASHAVNGDVVGRSPCNTELAQLWTAIGAEPNLVGGLRIAATMLEQLATRLDVARWDLEIGCARHSYRIGSRLLVTENDPLVRLQAARLGLVSLLRIQLDEWAT